MIAVETMFFDSDDYNVNTEVIPCDSKKTAKAVAKKIYEKVLEGYDFDDDEDRRNWENENVTRAKNGSIRIEGGDCGYAEINIIEKDAVTADTVSSFEARVGCFY